MKKPKVEPYYLIVFPTNTDGGKALDLLRKDGPVHGVECAGQAAVVASRSQLRKLTRAGIHWAYIKTKNAATAAKRSAAANRDR